MSKESSLPVSFDGTVRLFPLPNVVLFPRMTLPLHVFEPRYREMTTDALADDRLITMVLLKPGWEMDYGGKPAVHRVACIGRIMGQSVLDDGRYHLLLQGLNRVRIVRELDNDKLYRLARVELLADAAPDEAHTSENQRKDLAARLGVWLSTMGLDPDRLMKLCRSDVPAGTLADMVSFILPLDFEFKQKLLEELHPERRLGRLLDYLEKNEPPTASSLEQRDFPPDFSAN